LQQVVREFASTYSPGITIDYFAAAGNALVPRFAAWTAEAGAEIVDAFSARSWNHGKCVCGIRHRETGFFFPPNGLEDTVVRRAKSDGARGIFLVQSVGGSPTAGGVAYAGGTGQITSSTGTAGTNIANVAIGRFLGAADTNGETLVKLAL
jgi:hypothetical protein